MDGFEREENTDIVLGECLQAELYAKFIEAKSNNESLKKQNELLTTQLTHLSMAVRRSDALLHEYESVLMYGGASISSIMSLKKHAIKKANR